MSAGDELGVVEEWIYDTLAADATLTALVGGAVEPRIFNTLAPEEAGYPFVIFQHQGGPAGGGGVDLGATFDVNTSGPGRVCVESSWVVKAVGDGLSTLPLRPIVVRMDELLADAAGTTASGEVLACKRLGPVSYPQVDGSQLYRHRGGIYRIWSTA